MSDQAVKENTPAPAPAADPVTDVSRPDFSLVIPCYNEEEVIGYTVARLVKAFADAGHRLELVLCDNGSSDRTGEIIQQFVADGLPVRPHRIEINEGYGKGILEAVPLCTADWVGSIPADGQVDAEDVVRLYESVSRSNGRVLGKVHRRFRLDGPWRAIVSFIYNTFICTLFPGIGSFDVNGSPKMMHRKVWAEMELASTDWMLDPEIMIKSGYMGLRVLEMNVFSRMREHGSSHVDASTCTEFVRRLLGFRFGSAMKQWRRQQARRG